jgi:uroporphyrinogen-III synthase
MKGRSLSGVRVLVGRARHQASALSAELRKHGAQVIEIPFIEIRKPRSFKPLDNALKNLRDYDWLVLTSVNGVEAMWERLGELKIKWGQPPPAVQSSEARQPQGPSALWEGHDVSGATKRRNLAALAAKGPRSGQLRIAAIGPATKTAIEQRGIKVDVVPKEYVAESVVRSLRQRVKGKRVLLIRAKVARDVIPRQLRQAGAHVDLVEAYETVVPASSRMRLRTTLKNSRPDVITFTSSSTVRNFVALLGRSSLKLFVRNQRSRGRTRPPHTGIDGVQFASIGPVTSGTLHELGLPVDIEAKKYTIPGLVNAIVKAFVMK